MKARTCFRTAQLFRPEASRRVRRSHCWAAGNGLIGFASFFTSALPRGASFREAGWVAMFFLNCVLAC